MPAAHTELASRNLGFGLGLRMPHYADFLARRQPVDWLEVVTDNFLVAGGKPMAVLDAVRRDYPVALHGVAMSIGDVAPVDMQYLRQVKALADRIEPLWVSDHLCWTGPGPERLHDLYPLPYTDATARHVIGQICRTQDVLGRRLVIENVSSYITFADSGQSEWQFLSHIANAADCLLLLDVNNVYVSSVNHGFDPLDYLAALPAHRVQQIHLAGHADHGDHIVDTHDHPVAPAVWQLYAEACRRFGAVATMIERDDRIPPLAELLAELAQARAIGAREALYMESHAATQSMPVREPVAQIYPTARPLDALQRTLADRILAPLDRTRLADDGIAGRFATYHHAYRARLAEALADTFAKTYLYLGSDTFDLHARNYAVAHPPRDRSLNRYGDAFADALQTAYPGNPELFELARLDWDLRTRFDCADVAVLDAAGVQELGMNRWLASPMVLHPSVLLRGVTTNLVPVWNAIHADAEVPESVMLDRPVLLAVWRFGHQPHFRTFEGAHARFIEALAAGQSIEAACAVLVAQGAIADPAEAGHWLRGLLEDGLAARGPAG